MVSESQQPSEKDTSVNLKQLQYLLVKALPVLRDIYTEQNRELEVEAAVRGLPVTESDISWSELHPSERIYWFLYRLVLVGLYVVAGSMSCLMELRNLLPLLYMNLCLGLVVMNLCLGLIIMNLAVLLYELGSVLLKELDALCLGSVLILFPL
ncbi:hypothetical protein F2Q69_00027227 [Brassica cretica]|uniref:Uncharacterized protein n=1 Tax=Brassica cretica TaxID=69181 RepID=A0A8S9RS08_BRACR|nr:hypothetical protein F2Q69_00027227 [Brassica cretica]